MAIIKAINSKANLGQAINYVEKKEKTKGMIAGKDCNPLTAIDEMKTTKEYWGKLKGRQYKHYVQSFNPKDNVTPEMAYEIGKKFMENAKEFKGYEVIMGTHIDRGHIHNHFVVNSVNFQNGKKYQESKRDLERLKTFSNELSMEHGLSIPTKGEQPTAFDMKKYKALEKGFAEKGKSYLLETAKDIMNSLKRAVEKIDFIKTMNNKGYEVNWRDNGKNVTFKNSDGKKVRSSNLEETFKDTKFSKEGMMNEFEKNRLLELNKEKERNEKLNKKSNLNAFENFTEQQQLQNQQSQGNQLNKEGMENELEKSRPMVGGTEQRNTNGKSNNPEWDRIEKSLLDSGLTTNWDRIENSLLDSGIVTNWDRIEQALKNDTDRISEQSSDVISREIQQQVRETQERTERATREHTTKDGVDKEQQRDLRESTNNGTKKPDHRIRQEDWEHER